MKANEALRVLAEITAYQWGMVTSAQASMHGVTRLDLSRLTQAGHLKRLAHGVYMDSGAPGDQFDDLRAAWLSTDPNSMGEARLKDRSGGVVVAGVSAARLHDIGDLRAHQHEFVSPTRRQSQRLEIRYRQRTLDPNDVTLAEGLPVMTMECTIADLIDEVGDLSLVADALREASLKRNLDAYRLRELLAPHAKRVGLRSGDGTALLNRLLEIAGIDWDAVARRVAADDALGSRVAANYLEHLSKTDLGRLVMTPEMQETLRSVQDSIAVTLQAAMAPAMQSAQGHKLKQAGIEDVARKIADQFATSDAMLELSRAWAKSLSESTPKPETLTAIREAQRAITDG
jgi:predicted transcriptional regulator of viral defense system